MPRLIWSASALRDVQRLHRFLATKNAETKKALPANGIVDTGVTVIDKSNVEAFKAELAEMKKSVQ